MIFGTMFVKAAAAAGLVAALVGAPMALAHNKGSVAEAHAKIELRKAGSVQPKVKQAVHSHAVITASGKMHLIGAKVTSVTGSVIVATTQFCSTTVAWTINAAGATFGGKAKVLADIAVGDTVSVGGSIGASLTAINAKGVREIGVR